MEKRKQKILILALFLGLNFAFSGQLYSQSCYVRLFDASGITPTQYQLDALETAACRLRDSLPAAFQNSFKVYDFGFYLHNETMVGGYPEMFQTAITQVETQSQYYLLFGKQTDKTGVYTKFWFALKMPTTAQFSCMTALQREVYKKRVEAKTNDKYAEDQNAYFKYHDAEISGIQELIKIITEIKDCCVANRNGAAERSSGCDGCSDELANSYFDLNSFETYQISAQASTPANITKAGILDKSIHKITVNNNTDHIANIVDSLVLYLNTKFPLSIAITSNPNLCTTPTTEIESYLRQSGNGFKGWVNFSSTDAGQIPLKLRFYYEGSTSTKFTPQLIEILLNHLECEFSRKIELSNFQCDNTNILSLHHYFVSINADYRELNNTFATAPIWLWPIVRELGVELVIELLKRQGGKVVQLPVNVLEALRAIQQGDLMEFLDEAKDILANFGVPFKIFDAIWDAGELGYKANNIINKFKGIASSLGDDVFEKIFKAINARGFNVLEGLTFGDPDWRKAIYLSGKSVTEFFDDLKNAFQATNINPGPPPRFQVPGTNIWVITYVATSTEGPSIQIGNYKFRF